MSAVSEWLRKRAAGIESYDDDVDSLNDGAVLREAADAYDAEHVGEAAGMIGHCAAHDSANGYAQKECPGIEVSGEARTDGCGGRCGAFMVADGRQCVKENDHEDECVFVAHKQGRAPVGEPVASAVLYWCCECEGISGRASQCKDLSCIWQGREMVPLYTHPPAAAGCQRCGDHCEGCEVSAHEARTEPCSGVRPAHDPYREIGMDQPALLRPGTPSASKQGGVLRPTSGEPVAWIAWGCRVHSRTPLPPSVCQGIRFVKPPMPTPEAALDMLREPCLKEPLVWGTNPAAAAGCQRCEKADRGLKALMHEHDRRKAERDSALAEVARLKSRLAAIDRLNDLRAVLGKENADGK